MPKTILILFISIMATTPCKEINIADLQTEILSGTSEIIYYAENEQEVIDALHQIASRGKDENIIAETTSSRGDYIRNLIASDFAITGKTVNGKYQAKIKPNYKDSAEHLQFVNNKTKEIAAGCHGTDAQKVDYIISWLGDNISYRITNQDSLYDALTTGEGQCFHYAQLFYLIGKEARLDVRTIRGTCNGIVHEWNIVKINNTWYYVDPTIEINDVGNWTLIGSNNFINHSASKIYDNLTKHVSKTDFRAVIAHNPDSFQECIGFYLIMTIAGIIFGKELGMIILKRQLAM